MMNLTNVLPYTKKFSNPAECAEQLRELPVSQSAPILTTGICLPPRTLADALRSSSGMSNVVTGPFFGLENLARAKMPDNRHDLGPLMERHVVRSDSVAGIESDLGELIVSALGDVIFGSNVVVLGPNGSVALDIIFGPNGDNFKKGERFWRRSKRGTTG